MNHHAPIYTESADARLQREQRARSRRQWLILAAAVFTLGWITYCLWWGN